MSEKTLQPENSALVRALVEAYGSGRQIPMLGDNQVPANVDGAVDVQNAVTAALGETPGGWKVSIAPAGPVCAPMYASRMVSSGASRPLGRSDVFAIEVEFAVRLGRDVAVAPGTAPDRAEILASVATLLIGIELVESRLKSFQQQPFMGFVADNCANGGYVAGTESDFDRSVDLTGRHCRVEIDGKVVFDATAVHAAGDPLVPLVGCAGVINGAMGGWRAGQIVTLGSICGVIPVTKPGVVSASLAGVGDATVILE